MHRTGRWLGLDVDVGIYTNTASRANISPVRILTVEPGLYIVPTTKPAEDQPEIDSRWSGIGFGLKMMS